MSNQRRESFTSLSYPITRCIMVMVILTKQRVRVANTQPPRRRERTEPRLREEEEGGKGVLQHIAGQGWSHIPTHCHIRTTTGPLAGPSLATAGATTPAEVEQEGRRQSHRPSWGSMYQGTLLTATAPRFTPRSFLVPPMTPSSSSCPSWPVCSSSSSSSF